MPRGKRLISCLMPTYNKLPKSRRLLEEAVESFLRNANLIQQNFAECSAELIICNDTPGQRIICDSPGVRVLNLPERFANLGDKLNAMTQFASGDLLCRWDDDDLSLPRGLCLRYEKLISTQSDYVCFSSFIATNASETSYSFGSFAQCFYTRALHEALGGYRATSFGEDQDFERRAREAGFKVWRAPAEIDDTFYFYRWGTGSEHLSGYGEHGSGWLRIGSHPIVKGEYRLLPQWYEDFPLRAKIAKEEFRRAEAKKNKVTV